MNNQSYSLYILACYASTFLLLGVVILITYLERRAILNNIRKAHQL